MPLTYFIYGTPTGSANEEGFDLSDPEDEGAAGGGGHDWTR